MKYLLILLTFFAFSFTTNIETYDCRRFNFGVTPELVKATEDLQLIREENLNHNLTGLTYAEFLPNVTVLYTYTFHLGKLNGMKVKKVNPTGDNSYLYAYNNYKESLAKYSDECDVKIKESTGDMGLRSFHVTYGKKKVYVMMQRENQDIFLVENIFKK